MDALNSALVIRRLTAGDLAFAEGLRAEAGWNQTPADWRRFLSWESHGCYVAEWEGRPAGTVTTHVHGPALAWIGMMLVEPGLRRRGVGRALLTHAIEGLGLRGVRCVKLDATPLGRPLYHSLGFRDEWSLHRWERPGGAPLSRDVVPEGVAGRVALRKLADVGALEALDASAFGIFRRRLLSDLVPASDRALVLEGSDSRPRAFGFLRGGSRALYLGPVVASDPPAGITLANALLSGGAGHPVFWDIPDDNDAAIACARTLGFTAQRPLVRMVRGPDVCPGDPRMQFALAGPEVG